MDLGTSDGGDGGWGLADPAGAACSMKITTHLDRKTASGANWSNRWKK